MAMRIITLLFVALATFSYSAGQETDLLNELENDILQIRQKPGTDAALSSWLASNGVKEDTVYAYMYVPGSCPRCENSVKDYKEYLNNKGKKFVLITVFRDKATAEFYNKKKGYSADYYIYDTEDFYKKVFSLNADQNTSNMMKLTKAGRMLSGFEGMNFSKDICNQLIARTKPIEYRYFGEEALEAGGQMKYTLTETGAKTLDKVQEEYRIDVSPAAPLCEIYRCPYFSDDVFFYPDELLSTVSLFKMNHGTGRMEFERSLGPDEKEKKRFIDLDPETYKMVSDKDNLYYIVCNAWRLGNGKLGMSYSLPKIFFEGEDRIAYYNQPCILVRDMAGMTADSMFIFNYDARKEGYFYKHFQFSGTGNSIFVGCQKKTWPMSFEPEEYKGKAEIDPFMPEFYDTENPFMAEFDKNTGKLIRRFGHIDDVARKTMTGYYFNVPLSFVGGSELAYTDGCSGKVYVADTTDVAKSTACYEVFGINDADLPPMNQSLFYTYDHAKAYQSVFCRQITDMRITPERLYCIVTYGDTSGTGNQSATYSFVSIDRKTGKRLEYQYPKSEGCTVFTRGLREKDGKVMPFELLKRDGEAWLRVYGTDEKVE